VLRSCWRLAANASDQAADDRDGETEQQDEGQNSPSRLEESDERTLQIGLINVWLDFSLQLLRVENQINRVELVGHLIASEVVDHALSFLRLVRVLVLQDRVDCGVNAVIEDVALSTGKRADGDERDQCNFIHFAYDLRLIWSCE